MLFFCFIFFLLIVSFMHLFLFFFFFFNDTATTEIYTLSLHDALPIFRWWVRAHSGRHRSPARLGRSEEHTSELQSRENLVCRLLLEKKKKKNTHDNTKKKKKKKKQKKKNIRKI